MKYDRYWEMREGGPYDDGEEVFKCKDCGAVSYPEDGHDGEPDPGACRSRCSSRQSDWAPGRLNRNYKRNFDQVFPDAPGAGL